MKTLFLFASFLVSLFSFAQEGPPPGGFYKTYNDYLKDKFTDEGLSYFIIDDKATFEKNGKRESTKLKSVSYWGAKCNNVVYRFNPEDHKAYAMMEHGNICLYVIAHNIMFEEKKYKTVYPPKPIVVVEDAWQYAFFVSKGGEGNILPAKEDNLQALFADDSELLKQIKMFHPEKMGADRLANFSKLQKWVQQYNEKHK